MAENSSEKVESKTPNEIEELRKRRLAYFESTSTQSLQSQNEKDTAQSKQQLQSMTKDELQNIFDTDKEKKLNNNEYGDKHRLNNFKSAEVQNYGGYSKYSDNVDTGHAEYSKDEKDEFRLITEKLQHKMSQGGGDGCDEEVENLIRLAKREIAERYGNKNETTHGSSRIDAKGDNLQISNHTHKESTLPLQSGDAYTQPIREITATCDVSDSTQKRLNDSKISEKSHLQSHVQKSESKNPVLYRETIKPKKVEERNIEDLFSDRHPYSHNRQPDVHSSFKLRASDSHDFDSMAAFQKSVDTEVIDDLGLSTHRAESERLDSNVSDVHFEKEIQNVEEKLKQVSPRVFNEVTSDELRFALGAKKYKEFLEKSLRDIDDLHSDRSTDRRASSKELSKSKAYRGHKTAEKDKDLKLLKSEKQKSKGVQSGAEVKTKTNKNTNVEEKANIHHEIESEFTKVTESLDNVSGIKFDKGETTHVDTDMDNNLCRPLLNRPKHEPKNIYAPKQQMSEKDKDTPNRNYEQLTVARNVVFSADEIYNQAYKGHVPVTPDHFSSVPSNPHIQGQGHMMNPLYHSVNMGYGQQYIQQPPNPFVHNSPSVYGPGQFNHPQYHAYAHHHPTGPVDMGPPIPPQGPYQQVPGEMERYVQQMSARSLQSFDGSEFQKYPQYYSPVIPHPPESKPSSSEMKSRPVQNVHMKNLHQFPHKEPHPPGSVPHSARTSQLSEFTNYLQQMPKGIPYPPPPENVDLSAYFQYLSTQGYPMPYPRMMPTYPPGQAYVQMTPPYNRMDSAEMFVDDKTKVLETNGQIMIPHPPAQKRDESSPRRNNRLDITNVHDGKGDLKQDVPVEEHDGWRDSKDKLIVDQDSKNPSQRHIEGIRQFHEQRRLQQEEDEVLQKQRKFAKASIDRYFTSLENLYRRDHNQNLNEETEASTPHKETTPIKPPVDNDGEETLVNTEFTSATSIKAGGVTEREEKLGIDLSFIKGEGQKASKENMDNSSKSNGKLVIICPECGEVNKPYMSWCADCGDVLIGVNPILMKKGKNGKLKRCITENQNVEIENIKNVTFVEKEIEGDPGIVPQIVSERDGEISPVHDEVYKGKASPNKSDSRDSGRPSSEDMDYCRTEKEVTEICENISDPVIKGFIKAYFNRKKQAINMKEGKDTSTGDEEENDGEENTHAVQSNDLEAFASQIDVQNQENSHTTQNFDQAQSCPSVQNYVQVLSNSSAPDFVQANSNSHQITQEHQTQNQCDPNAIEPPVLSKTKPSYSKKKSKLKKNVPVDIEVFPSSERRSSGRSEPIVPILNLVNSSDEENEINEQRNRQLLDSSTDTNDLNEFFDPPEESITMAADSQEGVDNEEQQPFLAQVMAEINTPKPKRPSSGNGRGKRPSNNNARSIVRESIESAGYQRHWERSSIAWGSYNQRELSTKSSIRGQPSRGRPSSASRNRFVRGSNDNLQEDISGTSSERKPVPKKKQLNNRPASADTRRPRAAVNPSKSNRRSSDSVNAYESVDVPNTDSPKLQVNSPSEVDTVPDIPGIVHHRLPVEQVEDVQTKNISTSSTVVPMTSNERNFMKFQEMTPRIRDGELSMWLCFPDEIFLHILSYLSQSDLAKCAQVCKTFYRLVMDLSLWKYITVKKKRNLDDESLVMIGKRHPVSLALIQCHGENITARGLRELFRECSEYLRELNFSGCSRGALTGDCILLHASARCRNITHVDASWCNVTDSGIGAISESCNRLESLCINGCQMISDEGLETVIKKHGKSLRVLEMFGCFNITPKGIRYLGNHCINLITLNLGQCYKMTDSCITQLSNSLGKVETLDLRGCKNIKDNCMRYVVKNCPRLKTIVLANCPNISDVSVLEISTYTTDIRNIDVCGCRKITDSGIRALANNCQNLRYIDISSSGCSHRSVSMLANFCSQRLETVKLNFLSDVTETVLIKLAKHCKRLKLLHLYGCTSVRLTDKIREANPNLVVEM